MNSRLLKYFKIRIVKKNGVCLRPHGRSENILKKCSYELYTNHQLNSSSHIQTISIANFVSVAKFILKNDVLNMYQKIIEYLYISIWWAIIIRKICSTFFFIFKNKIYSTYRDLSTLIILNNVLKVTLWYCWECFSPQTSSCARINYELYIIFLL